MIKIVDLEKRTTGNRKIIRDFNIEIKQGEFVLVKGASGSGKTTLLKILAMIESYDSGQYFFNGIRINCRKDHINSQLRKHEIGYIPQNLNLIEDISAYENIILPLQLQRNTQNAKGTIYEMAEYLGIQDILNTTTALLSRGEQQRVAIARACVKKSQIIIADEPTASLDDNGRDTVITLLKTLHMSGKTIVLSSHDKVDEGLTDKVIELKFN